MTLKQDDLIGWLLFAGGVAALMVALYIWIW
jgi:hypothetical protein